jgi:hypothetical protein
MYFKTSLWAEFRMCKNEKKSIIHSRIFSLGKSAKPSKCRGGPKSTGAKGRCGEVSLFPRYLRIARGGSLSNSCTYTALPNDEVSGSCKLRHRRIISSYQQHTTTTNYLCQPFQLLEVINPAQSSTTLKTLTSWKIQG